MKSRVGIYGGSFNPVHFGHLRCALEVRERAHLTTVKLVPAGIPPHKEASSIAPAVHRLAMLKAAIAAEPGLEIDPLELERPGTSYTIDTLRELQERHPGTTHALILGFDSFCDLPTWKDFRKILAAVDLLITSRPPDVVAHGRNEAAFEKLPVAVSREFCYQESIRCYIHESGRKLEFIPVTPIDISASAIRQTIAAGASGRFLLPEAALDYLQQQGLYQAPLPTGDSCLE
jgi:nicotinate-nucleotide adenylyltransferase